MNDTGGSDDRSIDEGHERSGRKPDELPPQTVQNSVSSWFRRFLQVRIERYAPSGVGRATICSPLVGLGAGLGAVVFLLALQTVGRFVNEEVFQLPVPPTAEDPPRLVLPEDAHYGPGRWWLVLLCPTIGGLISGYLVFRFAPEAEGHGTDAMIRAFHRGSGKIRGRVPIVKAIASILTIGSGGSAGQEGPIAQIGAGLGSVLGKRFKLTPTERRLLMLAGAAGGVGAIFRAPLGGALFATEVLYISTATEAAALLPCLTASIIAYSTFALFITPEPIFLLPPLEFRGLAELPIFAVEALLCAFVGAAYVRLFYAGRDRFFAKLPVSRIIKPALGGLLVGLIALGFPQIMSSGYGWVQWGAIGAAPEMIPGGPNEFNAPQMGITLLLLLVLLKMVATTLTISSGGSGGVFGPSIFIGGMLGGALGQLVQLIFPDLGIPTASFVLVGMGGFFAGVSKTPLTSTVIVCEMAGSYSLLVPLMFVCCVNLILSRRWTLYEEQVVSPIDSPAHRGDFVIDVLQRITVAEVPIRNQGIELVPESLPFDDVLQRVAGSTETIFPVVDDKGRLTGIFSLRNVRMALLGAEVGPLVVADDIATRPVLSVCPSDDLHTAIRRLTQLNVDELPVVLEEGSNQLIGLLSRKQLLLSYTNQIKKLQTAEESIANSII